MSTAAKLYTRDVLALATSLAKWPLDPDMPLQGDARSPTCGSTIEVSLDCGDGQAISAFGLRARACAIGQASAAIFAQEAGGKTQEQIGQALAAIESWLGGGNIPDWAGFDALTAARDFPARHGAILLPWRAALVAFDQPR